MIEGKTRVSYVTLENLLSSMIPHNDRDEALMETWDMNKMDDVDALSNMCLKKRLLDFNAFGRELCKSTLLFRIQFDLDELSQEMERLQVVFEEPFNMLSFYIRVWETLFEEEFPRDFQQNDFYIDEIDVYNLQRLVFDKS